jgi:hypothetical protein
MSTQVERWASHEFACSYCTLSCNTFKVYAVSNKAHFIVSFYTLATFGQYLAYGFHLPSS